MSGFLRASKIGTMRLHWSFEATTYLPHFPEEPRGPPRASLWPTTLSVLISAGVIHIEATYGLALAGIGVSYR